MIDIQKIAREAGLMHTSWRNKNIVEYECGPASIERFAALIREAVVQELVAGSGEPVAFRALRPDWEGLPIYFGGKPDRIGAIPLYTADQLAGAVLRERERCAKAVKDALEYRPDLGAIVDAAIRSGE